MGSFQHADATPETAEVVRKLDDRAQCTGCDLHAQISGVVFLFLMQRNGAMR